jgi:PhzF family phenazine biosynthesis protein
MKRRLKPALPQFLILHTHNLGYNGCMKQYIVHAFTADGKNGNPAGVVLDAESLNEQQMLAIAAKIGLSETAFVSESSEATKRVRFFTPTVEEPLCGHATIATWSLLHQLGVIQAGPYTQETGAGILQVQVDDDGLIFMEQASASFYGQIEPTEIAVLLNVGISDFHATLRPQIVSTGIKDLLIPVKDKAVLAKIQPNLDGITEFSTQHNISGFHVFALLDNHESLACARNFAPADGIPEECATGTSNGALLCYLNAKNVLPEQENYRIEQGESMGLRSYIYGTFKNGRIWIGGHATIQNTSH